MRLLHEIPDARVEECRALAEGRRGISREEQLAARDRLLGIRKPDPAPTLQKIIPFILPPRRSEVEVEHGTATINEAAVQEIQDSGQRIPAVRSWHTGLATELRNYVKSHPGLTAKELAVAMNLDVNQVSNCVSKLHMNGRVDRTGTGGCVDPFRYFPVAQEEAAG